MKKILALVLSLVMLWACLAEPVTALAASGSGVNLDNALHFVVRHWHSEPAKDTKYQGTIQRNGNHYFVVTEGYIVPSASGYDFYFINQANGSLNALTDDFVEGSNYVGSLDHTNGIIKLTASPIKGKEDFSTFSVSAGHDAVSFDTNNAPDDTLVIKYSDDVRLVKAHVFYLINAAEQVGTNNDYVFGEHNESASLEIDTAWRYVYLRNVNGHHKNELVLNASGEPVSDAAGLPSGLIVGTDVALVKVYSTSEGLHTDKTASVNTAVADGRSFNLDLEVWYTEGVNSQVAMVLDASGSMAWTSEALDAIQLTSEQINSLGIRRVPATSPSGALAWDNYFLTNDQVNAILDSHKTDNSLLSASGYSYFVYDPHPDHQEYTPLAYWGGDERFTTFPESSKIIGYYAFDKGAELLNSISRANATVVSQVDDARGFQAIDDIFWPRNGVLMTASNTSAGDDANKTGFTISGGTTRYSTEGIRLDAPLSSNSFTISFNISKATDNKTTTKNNLDTDKNTTAQTPVDILYVGSMNPVEGDNYLRVIREGYDIVSAGATDGNHPTVRRSWLTGYAGNPTDDPKTDGVSQVSAFHDKSIHTVTYVFDGASNTITTYVYGTDGALELNYTGKGEAMRSTQSLTLPSDPADLNIILSAFPNDYNGADIYIDKLFVYDTTLDESDVASLSAWSLKGVGSVPQPGKVVGFYDFNMGDPNDSTKREWLRNTANEINGSTQEAKDASLVVQAIPATAATFNTATDNLAWPNEGMLTIGAGSTAKGILLDAHPDDEFTISFKLRKDSTGDASGNQELVDLMYIGGLTPKDAYGQYLRVIRERRYDGETKGSNGHNSVRRAWLSGYNGNPTDDPKADAVSSISSFHNTQDHYITYVYKDGRLTSYLDGSAQVNITENGDAISNVKDGVTITGRNIVLNGFKNGYNGANLYIDDLVVYNAALTDQEVANLVAALKSTRTDTGSIAKSGNKVLGSLGTSARQAGWYYLTHAGSAGSWNDYWANPDLMTAKRLIGVTGPQNGYSYSVQDNVTLPANSKAGLPQDAPGTGLRYAPSEDTAVRFYVDQNGYLRCFFSTGGIYADASNNRIPYTFASYVYELEDNDYIKVESLQRALGMFVTGLADASRGNETSAVRFSTRDAEQHLSELVLLDWTTDAGESARILSLQRGEGTSMSFTTSENNGLRQYNYGLTGNTSTQLGLKAFIEKLQQYDYDHGGKPDDNADSSLWNRKYLIIFTDGKDTDLPVSTAKWDPNWTANSKAEILDYELQYRQQIVEKLTQAEKDSDPSLADRTFKVAAFDYARQLKDAGYTIYTVLLTGGPVVEGTQDYANAHTFLRALAGTKDTYGDDSNPNDNSWMAREEYFFSTDKAKSEMASRGESYANMKDEDILTRIFSEGILERITHKLFGYTVTDYIDPRFDLVDADGTVWHLNQGGRVVAGDTAFTLTDTSEKTITLSEAYTDVSARTPYVRYDTAREMYYLEWVGQEIPSCVIGSTELAVWNARVAVRAKDDFIGGNAVMTNGNADRMNWVHHPDDQHVSSGTEDVVKTANDVYPSKGFPRTVVNVWPDDSALILGQTIFMGENLTAAEVAQKLFEESWTEVSDDTLTKYYWEYLIRFAEAYDDVTFEGLVSYILENDGFQIAYRYLPNADHTNQTGKTLNARGFEAHQTDAVGWLTYRVAKVDPSDEANVNAQAALDWSRLADYPADGVTQDTNPRLTKLTVEFQPNNLTARKADNDMLVLETGLNASGEKVPAYAWNPAYKPADQPDPEHSTVGKVLPDTSVLIKGYYYTRIVSGEVTLQVKLPESVVNAYAGETFSYQAELLREYEGKTAVVGTLEFQDVKLQKGQLLYQATFKPASAYMGYQETARDQYGLPLGNYTVRAISGSMPGGHTFRAPYVVTDPLEYANTNKRLFTKGTGYDAADLAQRFLATLDAKGNRAILGDKAGDPQRPSYLDYRFGLFRVTLSDDVETGSLAITKTVTGTSGETNKAFDFIILLSDTTVTGTYGDVTFNKGVANLTLKHGETKKAVGLPAGVHYSVSEPNAAKDGYTVTASGDNGQILADQEVKALFINARDAASVPQTGDNSHLGLWLALMLASLTGIVVLALQRRKNH